MVLFAEKFFYNQLMTEFAAHFRDDELDTEDLLLRTALTDLQVIVTDFMQRAGRSVNDLTIDEQQVMVDHIDPHLKFEMQVSPDIYKGMPIVVNGSGAFLAIQPDGDFLGAQVMSDGDVIMGTVGEVQALTVPSLELVLGAGNNDEIPTYELSLSAVIIIEDATFHTASSDGEFQVSHDLGGLDIVIPLVYEMDARVADIGR